LLFLASKGNETLTRWILRDWGVKVCFIRINQKTFLCVFVCICVFICVSYLYRCWCLYLYIVLWKWWKTDSRINTFAGLTNNLRSGYNPQGMKLTNMKLTCVQAITFLGPPAEVSITGSSVGPGRRINPKGAHAFRIPTSASIMTKPLYGRCTSSHKN
jgi:hypothetical protein